MATNAFTGTSSFRTDFNAVVERSVAIAQLPMQILNRAQSSLDAESKAVDSISGRMSSLRTSLDALKRAVGNTPFVGSGGGSIADTTITSTAQEGSYAIHVLSLGAETVATSRADLPTISDATTSGVSAESTVTLNYGSSSFVLTPAGTSLNDLVASINTRTDLGVRASVANVGSEGAPEYRLVLKGQRYSSEAITLSDSTGLLSSTVTTGSAVRYQVEGLPEVQSAKRAVELAPGVSATLKGTGSATIQVARNSGEVDAALSGVTQGINAVLEQLESQRGQSGGALSGSVLITTVASALRELGSFSDGTTTVQSLGIGYTQQGRLSFDASSATGPKGAARNEFLEKFLARADTLLDGLDDQASGALPLAKSSIQSTMKSNAVRLEEMQVRVDALRDSLNARLSVADALIASLEQQAQYMTNLYKAMQQSRG